MKNLLLNAIRVSRYVNVLFGEENCQMFREIKDFKSPFWMHVYLLCVIDAGLLLINYQIAMNANQLI